MDPNKALEFLRAYAKAIIEGDTDCNECLAETFLELDAWIASGGFMPNEWSTEKGVPEEDSHWTTEQT